LALTIANQDDLTDGFENLKSLFKFMGIFMVIILGIYVLFFVGAIVGGAVGSMF
ncbi:MAG: hypothetical protein JKX84_03060, partial [Flavobacteriales bacterium]|nr:hypothetical protein [Flavobacteriales bacterium]